MPAGLAHLREGRTSVSKIVMSEERTFVFQSRVEAVRDYVHEGGEVTVHVALPGGRRTRPATVPWSGLR